MPTVPCVLCLVLWLLAGPAGSARQGTGPLVVASIPPLGDLVRAIGGERTRVRVLLPPGASPHLVGLRPSQARWAAEARLLVVNGGGVDPWAERLAGACRGRALVLYRGEGNPHLWTSPRRAMGLARRIARALAEVDPEGAPRYRRGLQRVLARLAGLDAEFRRELSPLRGRAFLVHHPAWGPLARDYGLVQLAIEREGHAPSGRHLRELVRRARRLGIRTVFVEPWCPRRQVEALCRELGARAVELDPLGTPYPEHLREVLRRLREALREQRACPGHHGWHIMRATCSC